MDGRLAPFSWLSFLIVVTVTARSAPYFARQLPRVRLPLSVWL